MKVLAPVRGAAAFIAVTGGVALRQAQGSTPSYESLNPSGSFNQWFPVLDRDCNGGIGSSDNRATHGAMSKGL